MEVVDLTTAGVLVAAVLAAAGVVATMATYGALRAAVVEALQCKCTQIHHNGSP